MFSRFYPRVRNIYTVLKDLFHYLCNLLVWDYGYGKEIIPSNNIFLSIEFLSIVKVVPLTYSLLNTIRIE